MKVLVVNRGSSSIKCYVFEADTPSFTAELQWKNQGDAIILVKDGRKEKIEGKTLEEAFIHLLSFVTLKEIDIIGHRIVHGGQEFSQSVLITPHVMDKIAECAELAPLHNLAELEAIKILQKLCPDKKQVAVFDTAFHRHMPAHAALYAGPYSWYEQGICRYGFHGISFQYCSKRVSDMLQQSALKIVVCHLGSGASLCAIDSGVSIDTTMGFTPLEGLMMDTRCGNIDPGIILYLLKKKQYTIDTLSDALYKNSGLLGISGTSSDMRDIIEKSTHDKRAKLALDTYLHRLCGLIASMTASLKKLDALIFTAGIGENSALIREQACVRLAFLGIQLDQKKNEEVQGQDTLISTPTSTVKVLVIHTKEAFEIARECQKVI